MFSSRYWAGTYFAPPYWARGVSPAPVAGSGLTISGVEQTGKILRGSLSIEKSLNNRAMLQVKLLDSTRQWHPKPGETVYFVWGSDVLFGGRIETVNERLPCAVAGPSIISLKCVDWSRLFDRYVISEVYESKTLAEIVADIFQKPPLRLDGILIGSIPDFTFDKIRFPSVKVADAIRELCQLAGGLAYMVSPEKVFSIRDRSTYSAPWTIGDSAPALKTYRDLTVDRTLSQYRNVQWIVGGKDLTEPRAEKFHGDTTTASASSKKRTFNLHFPCGVTPTIKRFASGEWPSGSYVLQRVGVRGVDKDNDLTLTDPATGDPTWAQWFWEKDRTEIGQNSASDEVNNPTLTPNETLEVTYQGLYPVICERRDDANIADRANAEDGSGIYEAIEEDEKLDSLSLAEEKAARMLEQFGRIPDTLKFQADLAGLEPGHLMNIVLADHAIDAQFMVDTVRYSFPDSQLSFMRCDIQALDGERQEGWADYWRRAAKAGRKFSLRENEVVAKFVGEEDTITISDALIESVHNTVTIPPWDQDPFSFALIGVMTVEGVTYGKARIGRSRIGEPIAIP